MNAARQPLSEPTELLFVADAGIAGETGPVPARVQGAHTRRACVMTAGADSLLTVRWRDRSFVLCAPEQLDELARRLRQKGLAHIAESIRGAVAEDKTAALKVLSDAQREAVCAVLTDAESDPALRRAFNLLCEGPEPSEPT
jgi:hypothetical protein